MVSRSQYRFSNVTSGSLLLVEGIDDARFDDARFMDAFLNHINKVSVQIAAVGGKDNFRPFLSNTLPRASGIARLNKLAIVRDADNNPQGAFQSLSAALSQSSFHVPPQPWVAHQSGGLSVSIAILPDENSEGSLEDLCLRSIQNQPQSQLTLNCVNQYFACLNAAGVTVRHQSKTRLHAYLSVGDTPGRRLGEAAEAGLWNWNSHALQQLAAFLQQL